MHALRFLFLLSTAIYLVFIFTTFCDYFASWTELHTSNSARGSLWQQLLRI